MPTSFRTGGLSCEASTTGDITISMKKEIRSNLLTFPAASILLKQMSSGTAWRWCETMTNLGTSTNRVMQRSSSNIMKHDPFLRNLPPLKSATSGALSIQVKMSKYHLNSLVQVILVTAWHRPGKIQTSLDM